MTSRLSLTPEQENLIIEKWNSDPDNPPSLKELVTLIYGEEYDGRSAQGGAIKQFLSTRNIRAKASSDIIKKTNDITLSEDDKLFIANNAKTNSSVELARELFKNQNITNLHAETRVINEYLKTLDSKIVYGGQDALNDVPMGDYEPPKTLDKILRKVNEYVSYVKEKEKLNAQHKKNLEILIEYLHTYRFIRLMNTLESERDRKSCEDAFIRYTYDKPDLTQEEVDQYIELSNQVVQGFKIQRRSEKLQSALENLSNNDSENMKFSMSLVEAIGKAGQEYHQCMQRQEKLLSNLTQKRSLRLDSQLKDSASVLNLIQLWKHEEERVKLLKYVQLEQEAVSKAVDEFVDMSDIKSKILGLTINEIKKG